MALPKYYIPRDLERAIKDIESATSADDTRGSNKFSRVLNELKNIDCMEIEECHYVRFLKLGLYLEEYQQRKDMNKFEMHESTIEKLPDAKNKFKIYIKDLDEDNSLLKISDSLKVYEKSNPNTVFFLKVAKVCNGHVVVNADKRFCKKHSDSAEYSIVLIFNTYPFQCCHYALGEVTTSMTSVYFFPQKMPDYSQKLNSTQTWFNKNVFNNPEQRQAVSNIISKSSLPTPYILYGPPGTGKTSTLVEATCQIWGQQQTGYILICAPSNKACDVVTKRLLDYIPADNVYRIYSQSQEFSSLDKDIKKSCNYDEKGTMDDLKTVDFSFKKVIVTTLGNSLKLQRLNLCFSYVFIDEAGQATFPEAFLPICAVKSSEYLSTSLQVVISGDHQQLGPGIRSKLAEPLLGQSILEKLMKRDPYKKDEKTGYDPRYITKLIRNFRSSKAIIHVPNVLFYENELISCNKTNSSTFPVAFYAVKGKERKASNSTSSYNEDEIREVLEHVSRFVGKRVGGKVIRTKDIGIVTPFSLQASQIRKKLNRTRFKDVDVGTVEIYQGQEKEVIIVTTVRSKTFIHNGIEHIGFLSNPRRFNVALTRAKTSLVVVGSPSVLEKDKNWRYFMRYCQENNAYHGDSFVIKDELYYSMQELSIGSKCVKSTDLFETWLNILKIDDGHTANNRRKNIKSSRKLSNKTISPMVRTIISSNTISLSTVNPSTITPSNNYNNSCYCSSAEIITRTSITNKVPSITNDDNYLGYNCRPNKTISQTIRPNTIRLGTPCTVNRNTITSSNNYNNSSNYNRPSSAEVITRTITINKVPSITNDYNNSGYNCRPNKSISPTVTPNTIRSSTISPSTVNRSTVSPSKNCNNSSYDYRPSSPIREYYDYSSYNFNPFRPITKPVASEKKKSHCNIL